MTVNKKQYDNGSVFLVASEPSSKLRRRQRTRDRMKMLQSSSTEVLKVLDEINVAYPRRVNR
ncbi:hypothetical protein ABS315_24780 [Peribacillus frigoritolerans]|uniref:hypothetical protein n=1 Tax=Peribacillus frigoritolerans TaxID=450367 RepID=UPI0034E0863C